MARTADAIVVGAGIMGVATAYHLARRKYGKVVVLERDAVCSGSTALASGGIRHQYANRVGIELTLRTIEVYENFAAEFGVDPQFRQHGYLILQQTEEERRVYAESAAAQRAMGVDTRLLSPDEIRAGWPYLATDGLVSATYSPRDGYLDPYLVTTAIAARARELGAAIQQQHPVVAIERRGPRAFTVRTPSGGVGVAGGDRRDRLLVGAGGKARGRRDPGLPAPAMHVHHRGDRWHADPDRDALHHRPPLRLLDPPRGRGHQGGLRAQGRRQPELRHHAGPRPDPLRGRARGPAVSRAGGRAGHARVGRALRDDAGPDGHPLRGAGRGRAPRHRRLQRPRLHARARRGPAHGGAGGRRPRPHRGRGRPRHRPLPARRRAGRGHDVRLTSEW